MQKVKIEYSVVDESYFVCPECDNITFLDNDDSEGDIVMCDDCGEEFELRI